MARTFGRLVAAILIAAAFTGCKSIGDVERTVSGRRDYSVDPTLEYKLVALDDLVQHPTSYKKVDVEFEAMFYRRDESIWEHYHTPFTQDDYTSFSVWPLNTRVWELSGRLASFPTLYMHKQNPNMQKLIDVLPYSIVRIRGTVESDFEGRAWLRVNEVEMSHAPVFTMESLGNLVSGMNHKAEGRPATAIFKLEEALKGTLSEEARFQALMALGDLYEARYDFQKALNNYSAAASMRPDDPNAKEGIKRNEGFIKRQKMKEELKEPGK